MREAASWLPRLLTCKTWHPISATMRAPVSGVFQRGSETCMAGGFDDADGNIRGEIGVEVLLAEDLMLISSK